MAVQTEDVNLHDEFVQQTEIAIDPLYNQVDSAYKLFEESHLTIRNLTREGIPIVCSNRDRNLVIQGWLHVHTEKQFAGFCYYLNENGGMFFFYCDVCAKLTDFQLWFIGLHI